MPRGETKGRTEKLLTVASSCPYCAQLLPKSHHIELQFPHVKLNGNEVRLHPFEFKIFKTVYRSRLTTDEIVSAAYADDPGGGPLCATRVVWVTIWRMNRKLAKLGLAIRGSMGRGSYYEIKFLAGAQ